MCDVCKAEGAIFDEVQRTVLENREGNHSKQYTVAIEKVTEGYRVVARWGPIGKWVKSQEKVRTSSLFNAESEMRSLIDTKIHSRGYTVRVCGG